MSVSIPRCAFAKFLVSTQWVFFVKPVAETKEEDLPLQQTHNVGIENFPWSEERGRRRGAAPGGSESILRTISSSYFSHLCVSPLLPQVKEVVVLLSHAPRLDTPPKPLFPLHLRP